MNSPLHKNPWGNTLYAVMAMVVGVFVLFVSLSRASMQIWANEDKENKLRIKPVDFTINYQNGATESSSYKMPEVRTLPNNPIYGFKEARDSIWMGMTNGKLEKGKMALLLADKKMMEAKILFTNNEGKLALESSSEAIDKLKYAYSEIQRAEKNIETSKVKMQIFKAGYAYAELLKQAESSISAENKTEYKQNINDLNNWNEEREQENEKEKMAY